MNMNNFIFVIELREKTIYGHLKAHGGSEARSLLEKFIEAQGWWSQVVKWNFVGMNKDSFRVETV